MRICCTLSRVESRIDRPDIRECGREPFRGRILDGFFKKTN
jgi:hypothetical protein